MRDDDFYNAANVEGIKRSIPKTGGSPLNDAKNKAKNFAIDKKMYLVRGSDLFVIDSTDIKVSKLINGVRTINIQNAKLIRYGEDGNEVSRD